MRTVAAMATPDGPRQPREKQCCDRCGRCGRKSPAPIWVKKHTSSGLECTAVSAVEALKAARAADVELALDGGDLALSAASAPPAPVLDALSRHKAEIMALLRPGRDGWSAEDWQVYFDERAGLFEFDGGLTRAEADARAFECCVVEWLNRNPVCSPPNLCLRCGDGEDTHDRLRPYGTEQSGHAWLHSHCWEAWYANRKAQAVAVLSLILVAG